MPDTAYTIIKNKILAKLQGVTKLQEVNDEPKANFEGFPAAVIIPSDQDSDYETSTENLRAYAFSVSIFQEIQAGGLSAALDALYDVVDDVLDAFDKDQTLTGISLPTGYTMIGVRPAFGAWRQIEDSKLLEVLITIRVMISVDIV